MCGGAMQLAGNALEMLVHRREGMDFGWAAVIGIA